MLFISELNLYHLILENRDFWKSYRNILLNSVILSYRRSRIMYEVKVFRIGFLDKIIEVEYLELIVVLFS